MKTYLITIDGGTTNTNTPVPSDDGGAAVTGDTINVGALFNITGGQASLDEPGFRGFQLYFDELNAAGKTCPNCGAKAWTLGYPDNSQSGFVYFKE